MIFILFLIKLIFSINEDLKYGFIIKHKGKYLHNSDGDWLRFTDEFSHSTVFIAKVNNRDDSKAVIKLKGTNKAIEYSLVSNFVNSGLTHGRWNQLFTLTQPDNDRYKIQLRKKLCFEVVDKILDLKPCSDNEEQEFDLITPEREKKFEIDLPFLRSIKSPVNILQENGFLSVSELTGEVEFSNLYENSTVLMFQKFGEAFRVNVSHLGTFTQAEGKSNRVLVKHPTVLEPLLFKILPVARDKAIIQVSNSDKCLTKTADLFLEILKCDKGNKNQVFKFRKSEVEKAFFDLKLAEKKEFIGLNDDSKNHMLGRVDLKREALAVEFIETPSPDEVLIRVVKLKLFISLTSKDEIILTTLAITAFEIVDHNNDQIAIRRGDKCIEYDPLKNEFSMNECFKNNPNQIFIMERNVSHEAIRAEAL